MIHGKPRLKPKLKRSEISSSNLPSKQPTSTICSTATRSISGDGTAAATDIINVCTSSNAVATSELLISSNHDNNNVTSAMMSKTSASIITSANSSITSANSGSSTSASNIMTISSRMLSFPSLSIIPSQNTLAANEISCLSVLPSSTTNNQQQQQCFSLMHNPTTACLSVMPNNSLSFITNNNQQPVSIIPNTSISISGSPFSINNNMRFGDIGDTNLHHQRENICIPLNTISKFNHPLPAETQTTSLSTTGLCSDNYCRHNTLLR